MQQVHNPDFEEQAGGTPREAWSLDHRPRVRKEPFTKRRSHRRERIHSLHCYAANTTSATLGFSGNGEKCGFCFSALATAAADMVARFRAALVGIFGEPPQQPLVNPNTPGWMLWTIDLSILLGIVFFIATIVMIVLAFTAEGTPPDVMDVSRAAADALSATTRGLGATQGATVECPKVEESDENTFMWRLKLMVVVYCTVSVDSMLGSLRHVITLGV
mmetsp:Transcript_35953/g.101233  ORF Transcript_35953/g.101233 Transcript_35953/m.101233 type:complete len:218 (+) Transcript_35953:60-713(+)